jgi:hypothetical protein
MATSLVFDQPLFPLYFTRVLRELPHGFWEALRIVIDDERHRSIARAARHLVEFNSYLATADRSLSAPWPSRAPVFPFRRNEMK